MLKKKKIIIIVKCSHYTYSWLQVARYLPTRVLNFSCGILILSFDDDTLILFGISMCTAGANGALALLLRYLWLNPSSSVDVTPLSGWCLLSDMAWCMWPILGRWWSRLSVLESLLPFLGSQPMPLLTADVTCLHKPNNGCLWRSF